MKVLGCGFGAFNIQGVALGYYVSPLQGLSSFFPPRYHITKSSHDFTRRTSGKSREWRRVM